MNNAQANYEDEIDLIEMALELLSHWIVIVLSTVILGVGAFLYSKFMITPLYASTSELYILDNTAQISSLADIQIGNNMAYDYVELTASRPVLDVVIDNLSLGKDYKSLKSQVSVSNKTNTHILSVTVKDPSQENAKRIADEIARVARTYIAEKTGQKELSILHYGYLDGVKASPSNVKNAAMGAMAGFVLSCGIIVVFWLFNDRISVEEDVEKKLGLSVLAVIPYSENLEEEKEPKTKNFGVRRFTR